MSANGSQDSENASALEACELFFKTCPPAEDLCDVRERAKLFVEKQQRGGRLLALVTVSECCMLLCMQGFIRCYDAINELILCASYILNDATFCWWCGGEGG